MAEYSSSSGSSSSASSPLLSLVLTSVASHVVPAILVRISLSVIYRLFPSKQPRPEHARRIHALIVLVYVAYTVISHWLAVREDNFYGLLGLDVVAPNNHVALLVAQAEADVIPGLAQSWKDTILRQKWLALVRRFHPDKLGGHPEAVAYFRRLQVAHETLKTDSTRRVYERFGPMAVLSLLPSSTFTERDVVLHVVVQCVGWYVVSLGIFVLMPRMFGKAGDNKSFWRILTLVSLLSVELGLASSPRTTIQLAFFPYPILNHELAFLFRQCWLGFQIILTQLDVLSDSNDQCKPSQASQEHARGSMHRIANLLTASHMRADMTAQTLDASLVKAIRHRATADGVDERHVASMIIDKLSEI